MCGEDEYIKCVSRDNLTKRQKNLCNEQLAVNRDVICSVLARCLTKFQKPVKCLEGIGVCGINGMLWEKYFGKDVDVTVNGIYEEDFNLITKNLETNKLSLKAVREDPCVLLRKNVFDFIYLNCKTNASWYFDSVFATIKENTILVITTSEDSSLYWQTSGIALRNYGGFAGKTSYYREVSVRLVIAEMARTAAKYQKGLKINCTFVYKPQQSFTIVAEVKKGTVEADDAIQKIKKLAYCNLCENAKFILNSVFLHKINNYLSCDCSAELEEKVIVGIGPLWTGEIFNVEFVELMVQDLEKYPWGARIFNLFNLILEEARCDGKSKEPEDSPPLKKTKTNENSPYFYINTHRHSAKKFKIQKLSEIIRLLKKNGFRASRTHFDLGAVRTNASVSEYVKIINESFGS